MKKSDKPIIVEEYFSAPIAKVWNVITDLEEMKLWYFEQIDTFQPVVGSKSEFTVLSGERTFTHLWEVTEVEPPTKIVYNWKYAEYAGDSFVSFELFEKEDKTKLKLSVVVLEDFPEDILEFKRGSCVGGWNYFIKQRLKEYLE